MSISPSIFRIVFIDSAVAASSGMTTWNSSSMNTSTCTSDSESTSPEETSAVSGLHVEEIGTPLHDRVGPATLALLRTSAPPALPSLQRGPMDVRLSSGAKTAIIVGAVIVGVLLIVGVLAVSKGPKLKP